MALLADQNFVMYEGDSFVLEITVLLADGSGPLDLTGITSARWQLAVAAGFTPLISKALGTGVTVVTPAAGRVDVALAPGDTANLGGGVYRHELEITAAGGVVQTVLVGAATIAQSLVV